MVSGYVVVLERGGVEGMAGVVAQYVCSEAVSHSDVSASSQVFIASSSV